MMFRDVGRHDGADDGTHVDIGGTRGEHLRESVGQGCQQGDANNITSLGRVQRAFTSRS